MKACTPSAHAVPERVIARIWDRVDMRGPDECWPWKLSTGSHGYGQVGWKVDGSRTNAMTTAHRVAWMAANGETVIPPGMTVDHVCHNRVCCNPAHLRLLTNEENARDNGFSSRTHCPLGHPYDESNTMYRPTAHGGIGRYCRECMNTRWRPGRKS